MHQNRDSQVGGENNRIVLCWCREQAQGKHTATMAPRIQGNRQMLSAKYGRVIFFIVDLVKRRFLDSVQLCS
jgi:hypothetical protein